MKERVNRLRELLLAEGVDAFLVYMPENRYYFSGFSGSSGAVLITGKDVLLLTDFRYDEQAKIQAPHCEVILVKGAIQDTIYDLAKERNIKKLGCEGDFLTYQQYSALADKLGSEGIKPVSGLIDGLRSVKDSGEIERIDRSVKLSDKAFEHILPYVREGASEKDIALEFEFFVRKNAADGVAFPLIIASGQRSSMPHGIASEKRIARGDLVTMDFGSRINMYNSDITRTVVVGEKDKKQEEIYNIVLEAQLAGINAIKPGVPASEVDKAARNVIEGRGYGQHFGHGTGHGLGLQVHESPRLSAKDNTELRPGMVVTVEPGIYLPGWGGVRIEDTVLVESNGCRVLSVSPKKELIICGG